MWQWNDCFLRIYGTLSSICLNRHLASGLKLKCFSWVLSADQCSVSKLIMGVADAACDRQMDGLSHTSADFVVSFWKTIAHCTSPLTTQRLSHIHSMCNRETDGSALIAACRRCFYAHIVYACAWVPVTARACGREVVARSSVCHINRELQMLPLLLLCDIPIHFDAGPSSVYTNIKKNTRVHIASDSWSLIKSLAFVIIQNWL